MKLIARIYHIEKKLRDENILPNEFVKKRKDEVVPILSEFKKWLDEKQVYITLTSDAGKAVNYAIVESAKDNILNVYNYLKFLFTKLPYAGSTEAISNLLPCNLTAEMIKITV